jgi:hypothetical protein
MDLDLGEARAFHRGLKAAPHRFDFGEFGHRLIRPTATAPWLIANT